MVKAAIYSGGPRLQETWRSGYDIGIVVNKAAYLIPKEYWQWLCAGDLLVEPKIFADYPIPSMGYFAMRENIFTKYPKTHNGKHLIIWDDLPPVPGDTKYSITASLHLAAYIGATIIDVYGHNQTVIQKCGDPCLDMYEYSENRKIHEGKEVETAVDLLSSIGITITFKE